MKCLLILCAVAIYGAQSQPAEIRTAEQDDVLLWNVDTPFAVNSSIIQIFSAELLWVNTTTTGYKRTRQFRFPTLTSEDYESPVITGISIHSSIPKIEAKLVDGGLFKRFATVQFEALVAVPIHVNITIWGERP